MLTSYCLFIMMQVDERQNRAYTTTVLKRIISELELSSDVVIDELYEEYAQRMLSKAVCGFSFYNVYINTG
jgi:hypothetical protein